MDDTSRPQALRELDRLVGAWTLKAVGADGIPWPGGGRVTFEWHDSKAHLIERSTVDHPDAPSSVSIMGCDQDNGTCYQLYADDRGVCRVYGMEIGNGTWRLWREAEGFNQRFAGRFSDDGNAIEGRWEMSEDGETYVTDFDITFQRVTG